VWTVSRARLRALSFLAVFALGAVGACTIAFPMDDFRAHPAAALDATDGSAGEAGGGGNDGGPSGGEAGDGGPPPYTFHCNELAPAPKFCDDFERTTVLGDWEATGLALGGAVSLDTNDSRSPVRSLLSTTPGGSGYQSAYLHKSFSEVAATIFLRFDMKLDAPLPSGNGNVVPALVGLGPTSGAANNEISIHPTGTTWLEADYRVMPARFHDHPFAREPKFGQWEHVTVTLQTTGSSPGIKVTFDQDTVIDDPFQFPVSPSSFYLQVGLIYAADVSTPTTLHIDNVALDWQ
jgi:hypothetical protein